MARRTDDDVSAELADRLLAFATDIPGVLDVTHGPSVSPEHLEGGFDWGLVVVFIDASARDGYLMHASHARVSSLIQAFAERIVAFDIRA